MDVLTPFDPWKGRLCTCPPKYQLSPYTGCGHACTYCYITAYIPRAFSPRPKKDLLTRLERDLKRMDVGKHVSISNSSDPYTPPEEELSLTRETLRLLLSFGIKVQLITKSSLVIRDLDLIRRGNCAVSITVTTLDREIAAKLEPGAPPSEERIEALKLLSDAGVPTVARIDPIIPRINVEGLEQLAKRICAAGVRHIVASTYKAKADSFNRLVKAFPSEQGNLWRLFWVDGERLGGARYLARKLRRELLARVRDVAVAEGLTFGVCREGLPEFNTASTCDGSHLIPERNFPAKVSETRKQEKNKGSRKSGGTRNDVN